MTIGPWFEPTARHVTRAMSRGDVSARRSGRALPRHAIVGSVALWAGCNAVFGLDPVGRDPADATPGPDAPTDAASTAIADVTLTIPGVARDLVVDDLDQDGDLDLVVPSGGPSVSVIRSQFAQGNRRGFAVEVFRPTGAAAITDAVVLDLTRDGIPDLAIQDDAKLVVLRGNLGAFSPAGLASDLIPVGAQLDAGYYGSAGAPTVMVTGAGLTRLLTLNQAGDALTEVGQTTYAVAPRRLLVSQVDATGPADGILAFDGRIEVRLGELQGPFPMTWSMGDGLTAPMAVIPTPQGAPAALLASAGTTLSVLQFTASTLTPITQVTPAVTPTATHALDVDDDDDVDLVIAGSLGVGTGALQVATRTDTGYAPRAPFAAGTPVVALHAEDVDADMHVDLIVVRAGTATSTVEVWFTPLPLE